MNVKAVDSLIETHSTPSIVKSAPRGGTSTQSLADASLERIEEAYRLLERSIAADQRRTSIPLTVVIPVFNEVQTIDSVVRAVQALPIEKQIVIVDDGSTDGTRQVLEQYAESPDIDVFLHLTNQGKGAALQSGFRIAAGDVVIVQDADLEYNPNDILRVIAPILEGKADVVYGSRYLDGGVQDPSWLHRFGNQVLTGFSNWMTSSRLTDMETCYKAMRRTVLTSMNIEQRRFGFEPEITAKLARRGYHIHEVPIGYQSRSWKEGKKIGIKDLFNTLWCIVRYRFG
jgi:glycosyltransferase involved in cell wall biosynthesis